MTAEQAVERGEVLLSERLGRRHERGLAPVLGRAQHRVESDDRLPRPDLAHQEPLHRATGRQVAIEGLDGRTLIPGERERERREPGPDQLAQRFEDHGGLGLAPCALPAQEGELQEQELLEREPAAGQLGLGLVLWEVNRGESGGTFGQALPGAHPAR